MSSLMIVMIHVESHVVDMAKLRGKEEHTETIANAPQLLYITRAANMRVFGGSFPEFQAMFRLPRSFRKN